MPNTPNLNVRPSFIRATTDESIIPMAHLNRQPSGQSIRSQSSDHRPSDELHRQNSNSYFLNPPLPSPRLTLNEDMGPPMMAPPIDSPVRTGPLSHAERFRKAVVQPFTPQGVVYRNTAAVMPYWREGLFVATTVGMATWLGVLTGRMRAVEDIPYCVVN